MESPVFDEETVERFAGLSDELVETDWRGERFYSWEALVYRPEADDYPPELEEVLGGRRPLIEVFEKGAGVELTREEAECVWDMVTSYAAEAVHEAGLDKYGLDPLDLAAVSQARRVPDGLPSDAVAEIRRVYWEQLVRGVEKYGAEFLEECRMILG